MLVILLAALFIVAAIVLGLAVHPLLFLLALVAVVVWAVDHGSHRHSRI